MAHGHDRHASLGGLGATAGWGRVSQQPAVCPAPGSVPPRWLLTGSKVVMGCSRGLEASQETAVLAQGTGHLQGQGAAHPALASRGWFCGLWRLRSGPGLQNPRAWCVGRGEKEVVEVEVEGGEDGMRGPLKGLGFGEGQRRVPYAAAQLAQVSLGSG